ncbi:MAG: hypothetical protein Q9169_001534 [Polycauliona sp. 2 TL-2023]
MEYAAFHVVYVDKRISANLDGIHLQKVARGSWVGRDNPSQANSRPDGFQEISSQVRVVHDNLHALLTNFDGVHLCGSSNSCMATLSDIESNMSNLRPILVILEAQMALEARQADHRPPYARRTSTPDQPASRNRSAASVGKQPSQPRHSNLLKAIASRSNLADPPTGIIPVTFIQLPESDVCNDRMEHSANDQPLLPPELLRCFDDGAVDVVFGPLSSKSIRSIASHAYRHRKDGSRKRESSQEIRKSRKRSWVGFDDRKPYAYLREEMVSGLMTGICSPDEALPTIEFNSSTTDHDDDSRLAEAFTSWDFSAHELSEDQLVHVAFLMLQHALNMPELERWRMSADDLKSFLFASRAAYNSFVHYHNFRHVVDVMQAIFHFLLSLGILPPYPSLHAYSSAPSPSPKSFIGALLQPFDALTLLISAIGHDVGHLGVNNAFLVALNAPLAQLYNDKSVLESFHCAAYSQILRRYWKSVFEDTAMRGLMISSILATDMGLHFKYMADLSNLQEKIRQDGSTEGWSPQTIDEYRTLTCGLLIKCADISNVARPFNIAAKWADILQLEFANQGTMETELGMSTTLFGGPPDLGNVTKLATSQQGFMSIFACPLFGAISDILPPMVFAVEEMKANQQIWQKKVDLQEPAGHQVATSSDAGLSPRSGSPSRSTSQPELSHPEGFPASQIPSTLLSTISPLTRHEREEPRRASLASGPVRTSDPVSQVHLQDSRRSSLGAPFGYSSSPSDPITSSCRSSGGNSNLHGMTENLAARRTSSTNPSQLQLTLGHESKTQTYPPAPAAENIQPGRRDSEGTLSQTDAGSRSISIAGGGGSSARKGSKSSDGDQTIGQQRPTGYSVARQSPFPAHERHSSGGHTSRSQSVPYSPTDTQATSVTEDSEDRNHQMHERGGGGTVKKGQPKMVNLEKPGSGHQFTGPGVAGTSKSIEVKTVVANGGTSSQHAAADRFVTRKSSRFLNFWKKRAKVTEPSP